MSEERFLLFDLDGTLTDPGEGITNSVAHALRRSGVEPPEREKLYPFIGPPLIDSFQRFYGFDADAARRAVNYYREYYCDRGIFENRLYPGIPELLKELTRANYRLVLATSKPELFAQQILEHFSIAEDFYLIAGAAMDESRTRKDEVIAYALHKAEANPKQCCMIGDREYDVIGAKKFGIPAIGVLYGYGSREELERAGAAAIAESVSALGALLLGAKAGTVSK